MSGMLTISSRGIPRNILRLTTELVEANNPKVIKSALSTKACQKQYLLRLTKPKVCSISKTRVITKWPHHDRLLHTTPSFQATKVVNVPPFADSVSEGDVKLDKKVGDYVAVDEVVMEIETDKTSMPVPAPEGGVIEEILVKDGDTVKAGQALFKLNTSGSAPAGGGAAAKKPAAPAAPAAPPKPAAPRRPPSPPARGPPRPPSRPPSRPPAKPPAKPPARPPSPSKPPARPPSRPSSPKSGGSRPPSPKPKPKPTSSRTPSPTRPSSSRTPTPKPTSSRTPSPTKPTSSRTPSPTRPKPTSRSPSPRPLPRPKPSYSRTPSPTRPPPPKPTSSRTPSPTRPPSPKPVDRKRSPTPRPPLRKPLPDPTPKPRPAPPPYKPGAKPASWGKPGPPPPLPPRPTPQPPPPQPVPPNSPKPPLVLRNLRGKTADQEKGSGIKGLLPGWFKSKAPEPKPVSTSSAAPPPPPPPPPSAPSSPPPAPPKPPTPTSHIPVAAMRHAQAIDTAIVKMPPQDPTKEITGTRTEQRVKMNRMRLKIASRLKEAQNTNAMLTTFNEIDMSAIMQFRKDHLDGFVKKYGMKLGFMSAFCKASAYALQDQPVVNAVIDGSEIIYRDYVDISVAVATPKGLVVPVLRNVESMNFADIEIAINELGQKAKKGAITVEDMDGGTFTISNGGVFGSLMGTPIINPPQSSILGMHGIFERPIAVKGQVVIRPMMYVALTYDHRLIDGREAVMFLRKIKAAVEDPRVILAGL